ncbi:MAG: hypothetical protein ACLSBH_07075 [Coprobacillus cateniformis]
MPPHGKTPEERNKVVEPKKAFIDIGVFSKQEALDLGIKKGDPITPVSEFTIMANEKCLMSKAWDASHWCSCDYTGFKKFKRENNLSNFIWSWNCSRRSGLTWGKNCWTDDKTGYCDCD